MKKELHIFHAQCYSYYYVSHRDSFFHAKISYFTHHFWMVRNRVRKVVMHWEGGYMVLNWISEESEPLYRIARPSPSTHNRNHSLAVLRELHALTRVVQVVGILLSDVHVNCHHVPCGGIQLYKRTTRDIHKQRLVRITRCHAEMVGSNESEALSLPTLTSWNFKATCTDKRR